MDFLLQLLLSETLLDLRPLRHLLHLLRLLLKGLPDELRLQTLLLVLAPPTLLEDAVAVLLLTLTRIEF